MAQIRRLPGVRAGDEISALDRRIIEQLTEDGRRPFTQIAGDLGVSEAAVRARTNRLIDRDILQIVALTDPVKLGLEQMATIGVHCDRAAVMPAADAISGFSEVRSVVIVAGSYDLLVEVACTDSNDLLDFLDQKLGSVPGVRGTETFTYLRVVKPGHQRGRR